MSAGPSLRPSATPTPGRPLRVALAGNPNAGKTTLFNALTGARARTGNYPGLTVDQRIGALRLPGDLPVELIDIPGTYSLASRSREEEIAVEVLLPRQGPSPDAAIVVLDATTLERHLYLALQVVDSGLPTVVVLNMMDEAESAGVRIDEAELSARLGAPVVPAAAGRGRGLAEVREALAAVLDAPPDPPEPEPVDDSIVGDVAAVEAVLAASHPDGAPAALRARALWALLSVGDDELEGVPEDLREVVRARRTAAEIDGRNLDLEIIAGRYARIDELMTAFVQVPAVGVTRPWTDRLDAVLTHPVGGFLVFAVVMYLLFEALFSWSDPAIGVIEAGIGLLQGVVGDLLPEGPLRDLLSEGVIAGVGNVVVFIPQIALLFLFIGILEDSGYLARVAFLIDRVMRAVGLHGKAFVPLLSGFACAVPAVMATRTIESRRDRLVTMLALPLMSCSARLPVYALVIAVVFSGQERLLGVFSVGAVVLFAMYGLSVGTTLLAAAVMRRTILRGPRPALVLELPPYRRPGIRNVLGQVGSRVRSFLVDAGTVILAITIILWGLLSYPQSQDVRVHHEQQRAEATRTLDGDALDERLGALDQEEAKQQLRASFAGQLGRTIEPAIAPLGFDWRIGIGLIGSFAAREVLVSTLGIVWGVGEADEESPPLRRSLIEATRPDGSPLFTPLSGLALMVFFVLAAQCMSTLAVIRRETGTWRWPLFQLAYMTALAYAGALLTYQGGLLLGFT